MTDRASQPAVLQGTLESLILSTLRDRPLHGYAIARTIEQASGAALTIEEGSLYPALYRLERRGDIAGEWSTTESGRRARVYRLTPAGRKRLKVQVALWKTMAEAVNRVLGTEPGTGGTPVPAMRGGHP